MTMSVFRSFDTEGFDPSSVDALPVLFVSSVISGNLSVSYPLYTNEHFATESFGSHKLAVSEYTP